MNEEKSSSHRVHNRDRSGVCVFGAIGGAAGVLSALLVAAILIVLVNALSMRITTAYHTCL